jgi:Pregnancy-associated plasma protein-A
VTKARLSGIPPQPGVVALVVLGLLLAIVVALWDLTPRRDPEDDTQRPAVSERASSRPPDPSRPAAQAARRTNRTRTKPSTPNTSPAPAARTHADPESRCGGIGAFGVCEGDVAKACVANRVVIADCGKAGGRCALTSEGAQCMVRSESACRGTEPTICEGSRLRRCIDGTWEPIDCAMRGARCIQDHEGARCEVDGDAAHAKKRPRGSVELCDGHDNDLDERVDEHDVCGPVPLVAFVPEGFEPVDFEQRMQQDLAHLSRIYAPTRFVWQQVSRAAAELRSVGPRKIDEAAVVLAQALPGFYVPVLYAEELVTSPPKAGIATLPNNRCGGVRMTDRPSRPDGVIVLTDKRQPETLAHEVGHYLGLCHTHEDVTALAAIDDTHQQVCQLTGDAMCDTPLDPGPARCDRDAVCSISCSGDGAEPDPTNLMSYYIGCREQLTYDQLAEVRRNLALRRDWRRCLDPAACPCTPGDTHACPHEMSCRPQNTLDGAWHCELDGAALPGHVCEDTLHCSDGSFCLRTRVRGKHSPTRCVRPCTGEPDCTCVTLDMPFGVCAEDLPEAKPRVE